MEYESGLKLIRSKRAEVYKLSTPIIACLLAGVVAQFFFAPLAKAFGVLVFVLFYKRFVKAARFPCPQCEMPFGTNSKLVLGLGTNYCQNCGLGLYESKS